MKSLYILRLLPLIAMFIACLAASGPRAGEFPDDYFFYNEKRPEKLRAMGSVPPLMKR